jgi:hypothetical protein
MAQTEYKDVKDGDWTNLRQFVRRGNERLAVLEGYCGQNSKYSNIKMNHNKVLNGPANQIHAENDEFITKDYLASQEAFIAINPTEADNESGSRYKLYNVDNPVIVSSDLVDVGAVTGYMFYWKTPLKNNVSMMKLTFDLTAYLLNEDDTSTYMDVILPDRHKITFPFDDAQVFQTDCIAKQSGADHPSYFGILTYFNTLNYLRIGRVQTFTTVPSLQTMNFPVSFESFKNPGDPFIPFNLCAQIMVPVVTY